MRTLIAFAALVLSTSATAERYLAIDLRSMDYFWMEFSGSQEERLGYVTFNRTADHRYEYGSAYAARRYVGAGKFEGYMSIKTFTVKRHADKSPLMSATATPTGWEGFFQDENGDQDGRFIATTDFDRSRRSLWYICGDAKSYRCVATGMPGYSPTQECKGRGFPGKFSHLTRESCEDELKSWQADKKARQAEEQARQAEEQARKEDRICAPENKSASSFSVKRMYGCIEPVSFKTAQTERLLYDKCLVSWVKASRITTFERGSYDSMFSVFKDRTEYEFASTVEETTFDLYFNDDVPEDLKYLVNEAAYSCVVDPFSAPPEGFWPIPWAKPSWEAEAE